MRRTARLVGLRSWRFNWNLTPITMISRDEPRREISYEVGEQWRQISVGPVLPIAGPAMLVCHSQYQHFVRLDGVDHAVRKSPQPAAADIGSERMPACRVALDQLNAAKYLHQEALPQPWRLSRIPDDGFVQLGLGRRQQTDSHTALKMVWYFAITSDSANACTSPRR